MENNQKPKFTRDLDSNENPHPFYRIKDKTDEELGKQTEGWLWTDYENDPCLMKLTVLKEDYPKWREMSGKRDMKAYILGLVCHNGRTPYALDVNYDRNSPFLLDGSLVGYYYYTSGVGRAVSPGKYNFFDENQKKKADKLSWKFL